MSRVLIVLLIAVGAVACGGGGDGSSGGSGASETPSQSPSVAGAGQDSASGSGGRVDAVSDLSEFVCEPDAGGQWNASGVITNSSGQAADYRVTVVVSEGSGASLEGKRRTLTDLVPDSPESFDIERLPAVGEPDPACQVQVLRLH